MRHVSGPMPAGRTAVTHQLRGRVTAISGGDNFAQIYLDEVRLMDL
jgi:hypothetical protein